MKKIVFIGGVGKKNDFGGELTKNKTILDFLQRKGYRIDLVDTYNSRKKPWKLIKLPFYLVANRKEDIIISTTLDNIVWLLKILIFTGSKRNIIYWGIGGNFPNKIKQGIIDKKILSIIKIIIVEGNAMKETLAECGITNVLVCPNFKKINYLPDISVARKDDVISKQLRNKKYKKFVFLSRIQPEKGVDIIINVARKLNDNGYENNYIIDFYGSIAPNYQDEFLSKINIIGNLEYKGRIDLTKNMGYDVLSTYDMMLFPTYWRGEGFPGVVIDAYISGLPIVATDWHLNKEFIVDGETGFIISSLCIDKSLYEIMERILNGEMDEKIMLMSDECQKRAASFDVDFAIENKNILTYLS
ncbi:MAG: glycosyltransferase [Candidatus Phocaeicola faecipullorum]|nr:glycosyltransferase [Candidatus Phocaeicola faecipullorum]